MYINIKYSGEELFDIIDAPAPVAKNIALYQQEFFAWLFDKSNHHKYWIYKNGEPSCCSYDTEVFVDWLNTYPLRNSLEKVVITARLVKTSNGNLNLVF